MHVDTGGCPGDPPVPPVPPVSLPPQQQQQQLQLHQQQAAPQGVMYVVAAPQPMPMQTVSMMPAMGQGVQPFPVYPQYVACAPQGQQPMPCMPMHLPQAYQVVQQQPQQALQQQQQQPPQQPHHVAQIQPHPQQPPPMQYHPQAAPPAQYRPMPGHLYPQQQQQQQQPQPVAQQAPPQTVYVLQPQPNPAPQAAPRCVPAAHQLPPAEAGGAADPAAAKKKPQQRLRPNSTFNVGPRYKLIRAVGSGAYGLVWSAIDLETPAGAKPEGKGNVAIKKVTPFFHETDAKRVMREVLLLSNLKHPNILSLRDIIYSEDDDSPQETQRAALYFVLDLMDVDLHKVIQSRQKLTDRHIQYITYQILRGLKYIHSAGILHRDMKPSNVLVNSDCHLKISDFGLARPIPKVAEVTKEKNQYMTEYVVTRWYRSPELLLQEKFYTTAIDVWSTGCILAEALGRKPLFPGNDYIEQLICITNLCGTPSEEDLKSIGSKQAQNFVRALEDREAIPLKTFFPDSNPDAIDLLTQMLQFNHRKRMSIDEALSHPYLAHLHDRNQEV
ncbi:Mitogen-activated protein kinase 5 [Diplonema papillatum]|nr:Mitogen-activated protein kinase 5 [Diplonema papillatum]